MRAYAHVHKQQIASTCSCGPRRNRSLVVYWQPTMKNYLYLLVAMQQVGVPHNLLSWLIHNQMVGWDYPTPMCIIE